MRSTITFEIHHSMYYFSANTSLAIFESNYTTFVKIF